MRICSLLPSATEIAFALGLGDAVVGVTHECDYPPEARNKPVLVNSRIDPEEQTSREIDECVGRQLRAKRSIYAIDLARFRHADPDLILTQELCEVCALDSREVIHVVEKLSKKPNIVALKADCLSEVLADIRRVGNAAEKPAEAGALVKRLEARIAAVAERAAGSLPRPRVACLEWLDPVYSAGHWVPEMVALAGGHDGLARPGQPSAKITWDKVLEFNPEVIVLMPCGFGVERTVREIDLVRNRPGWKNLPAVEQGSVFAVAGAAYFNRPGPRLVDGLELLGQIIHPELFTWTAGTADARRLGAG